MAGEDVGPEGMGGGNGLGDDPELAFRMMNDTDRFACTRGHRPGFAEEINGVVGIEPSAQVQAQMQIQ